MNSPLERCRRKMSGANWKRTFSKKVLSVQLDESDPFGPQAFIRGARVYWNTTFVVPCVVTTENDTPTTGHYAWVKIFLKTGASKSRERKKSTKRLTICTNFIEWVESLTSYPLISCSTQRDAVIRTWIMADEKTSEIGPQKKYFQVSYR